jgi:hypothetical protein
MLLEFGFSLDVVIVAYDRYCGREKGRKKGCGLIFGLDDVVH